MKNIAKLLTLAFAVSALFVACNSNQSGSAVDLKGQELDANSTRGINQFEHLGSKVSIATGDIITITAKAMSNQDDEFVANINRNLLTAENTAAQLNVKFSMSDAPVDNGMLIFGIEAEQNKKLTVEMYDEEGYSMAASNSVNINSGNNYKALNVNSLENGEYFLKLKDSDGKELVRKVTIKKD